MDATLHLYTIGKRYHPTACLPEGDQYNFRCGGHELVLVANNLSRAETFSAQAQDWEFALYVREHALFLLYRCPPGFRDWSDAPYCWWRVPGAERVPATPTVAMSRDTRALLTILLVEGRNQTIAAMRHVTLAPPFTRALHDAIRNQAEAVITDEEHDEEINRVYTAFPSSASMEHACYYRCKGGD